MGSAGGGDAKPKGAQVSTTKEEGRLLLTPAQVTERLQVSQHLLKHWRLAGEGPKFLRLGHCTIRYPANAVEAWLREQEAREQ